MRETRGRAAGSDKFTQRSLGFFATASEAGTAFAAAAAAAKASGEAGDRMLECAPLAELLSKANAEGGLRDMNAIFKEVDKEDREDGHREDLELIVSHRSDSGYKVRSRRRQG